MPKRKRRKQKRNVKRPSSSKMNRQLVAAMERFEEGEVVLAMQLLLQLAHHYPRSKAVIIAILEVSQDMEDWPTYAYYGEKLLVFERGDERDETRNNLIYAYMQSIFPALAWHHARILINETTYAPFRDQAKTLLQTVEPMMAEEVSKKEYLHHLTQEEQFETLAQYDQMRFFTETQHPEDAIVLAESLLQETPHVVSLLNNLSLAYYMSRDVEQAIETSRSVLAQEDDNFHALGNLVRFTFLSARFEEAQTYAERLQAVNNDFPDLEVKQAEAFAFIGDDTQVWAAYERAKMKDDILLSPLLLHLAAVAAYRLGKEKKAWSLWETAVQLSPHFELAQNSLADKGLPIGERDVPWYWTFPYWLGQDFGEILRNYIAKDPEHVNEKQLEKGIRALLAERPYLLKLFPHMLERGDRQTREFVLNIIRMADTAELAQICYDFALSPHGADDLRMEAIQFISEGYPSMLPPDKMVPLWVMGEQKELFMMGFEIIEEPEGFDGVADEILDKHEAAYDLLMARDGEAAEPILQEIIAEAPEFYTAYNQLAIAYELQGRSEEAYTLIEETHTRFPDYFFARIGLARMKSRDGEIEEAKELIRPLLLLSKLHISEFRALAQVQMDIALTEDHPDAARTWLEMWRQMEDDHPDLARWEMRIDTPNLMQNLEKLMRRGKEGKRKRRQKK